LVGEGADPLPGAQEEAAPDDVAGTSRAGSAERAVPAPAPAPTGDPIAGQKLLRRSKSDAAAAVKQAAAPDRAPTRRCSTRLLAASAKWFGDWSYGQAARKATSTGGSAWRRRPAPCPSSSPTTCHWLAARILGGGSFEPGGLRDVHPADGRRPCWAPSRRDRPSPTRSRRSLPQLERAGELLSSCSLRRRYPDERPARGGLPRTPATQAGRAPRRWRRAYSRQASPRPAASH